MFASHRRRKPAAVVIGVVAEHADGVAVEAGEGGDERAAVELVQLEDRILVEEGTGGGGGERAAMASAHPAPQLTPVQHWMLGLPLAAPGHWSLGFTVALPAAWRAADVGPWLQAVVRRHDALGLHFERSALGSPMEVVSTLEGWVKVRESGGQLAWVEAKSLGTKRTVSVSVATAAVRAAQAETSALVFQAQQGVILELIEYSGAWVHVRHRDGLTGYVRAHQVRGL